VGGEEGSRREWGIGKGVDVGNRGEGWGGRRGEWGQNKGRGRGKARRKDRVGVWGERGKERKE